MKITVNERVLHQPLYTVLWISPALCPGLGYTTRCIGLLMGEIYLDGTEYTDRTVIISPRVGIQR